MAENVLAKRVMAAPSQLTACSDSSLLSPSLDLKTLSNPCIGFVLKFRSSKKFEIYVFIMQTRQTRTYIKFSLELFPVYRSVIY